jgi:hypothetical protein
MSQTPDYSDFRAGAGDNILASIAQTAREQLEAEAKVARLEDELKSAQASLRNIQEHVLPRLMEQAEQSEVTTAEGIKVEVKEVLRGSIPEASQQQAFAWLETNNAGALIKREVTIEFGKGEEAWAAKFMADLSKRKRPVRSKAKKRVHPQTLLAFLREQLEAGNDIPLELFGVFRQRFAKITLRK